LTLCFLQRKDEVVKKSRGNFPAPKINGGKFFSKLDNHLFLKRNENQVKAKRAALLWPTFGHIYLYISIKEILFSFLSTLINDKGCLLLKKICMDILYQA